MKPRKFLMLFGGLAAVFLPPARAAIAQSEAIAYAAGPASANTIHVDLAAAGGGAQSLSLPVGKSAIIDLPVDARDVIVSQPGVADAVLRSPRRIFIMGLKAGSTDAVFFDAAGHRILALAVRVDQDTSAIAQTINRILPRAAVRVDAMNDSVILSGQVANLADADKAVQIARAAVSTAQDATGSRVLNMLSIAGKDQVMLKVRVVEMQRNVIKQMGVSTDLLFNDGFKTFGLGRANTFGVNGQLVGGADLCYGRNNVRTTNVSNSTNTSNQSGSSGGTTNSLTNGTDQAVTVTTTDPVTGVVTSTTTTSNAVSNATNSGVSTALTKALTGVATTAFQTATGNNTNACLQAFERVGLVRTLAEPNLTAVSGESAKFLAGGEYPIPVAQDAQGRITVDYKPFGVGLGFTPVVLSSGRIALKISTEVSELSTTGAFTLGSSASGTALTIPALNVRRAETSVELPSGGAMMIAGLLQEKTKQNIDSLPGMTTLPVLGSLFRSRDYLAGETELVIIVTPYLVQATSPDKLQTPVDGLRIADDASTLLLGQLNKAYKTKSQPQPGRAYQGPYGYVIE
jgi:pilus assembly protein CpaC